MNALFPVMHNSQVVGFATTSHQRAAIRSAQRGNWKAADTLELQFLADQLNHHDGCEEHCAWCRLCCLVGRDVQPTAIYRCYGRHCEDCVEWCWTEACRRCAGSGHIVDEEDEEEYSHPCRACDATGLDTRWLVTDLDGHLVEVDRK